MKKRLSLIPALLLVAALSVDAALPLKLRNADANQPMLTNIDKAVKHQLNGKTLKSVKPIAELKKAPARASIDGGFVINTPTIITEAPAGETKQFSRSSYSFYYSYFFGFGVEQVEGNISEVVFAEDGSVYFKDPIAEYPTDSYIKGTLSDGIITVNLPQAILSEDGDTYYADLQKITIDWDEGNVYYDQAESQVLRFSYENGVIQQLDSEDTYLSMSDAEGEWTGFGDTDIVMTPFVDESIKDVDLEGKEYAFLHGGSGHFVTVAKDDKTIYIKGIFESAPDTWIKGTLSGNTATFEPQTVGVISGYQAYFVPATYTEEYWKEWNYYYTEYTPTDELVLTYDPEKDAYTAADSVAITAFQTLDFDEYSYYLVAYKYDVIKSQGDLSNATPKNPVIEGFVDYSEYSDEGAEYVFDFDVFKISTDGDLLDSSKVFYNVFVDGEPYTFYSDMYDVEEDITDIPFGYSTDYDFYNYDGTTSVELYCDGFDTVGVQTIYRPEEGKEIKSDLIEININTGEEFTNGVTGVNNIAVDKAVKSEVYYDLTGRRVVNPENGLFIKKVTFNDNTVKVSKIAK
jgi:hypothetical protein